MPRMRLPGALRAGTRLIGCSASPVQHLEIAQVVETDTGSWPSAHRVQARAGTETHAKYGPTREARNEPLMDAEPNRHSCAGAGPGTVANAKRTTAGDGWPGIDAGSELC